jgi:hypothetical protein
MSISILNSILGYCLKTKRTDYKLEEFLPEISGNYTVNDINDFFSNTKTLFKKVESFDARTLTSSHVVLISISVCLTFLTFKCLNNFLY